MTFEKKDEFSFLQGRQKESPLEERQNKSRLPCPMFGHSRESIKNTQTCEYNSLNEFDLFFFVG